LEGRARWPISVRYGRELRDDPDEIGRLLLPTAQGGQIPLSRVADVRAAMGPDMIRSEDGRLVGFVFVDPGERALADYVAEAQERVAAEVSLPPGVRVDWTGQFEYYERARGRL